MTGFAQGVVEFTKGNGFLQERLQLKCPQMGELAIRGINGAYVQVVLETVPA